MMGRTVIIVRDEVLLPHVSASHQNPSGDPIEIVVDRRRGDRRRQDAPSGSGERRQTDRRVNPDVQPRLRREGFAVVHA